MQHLKSENKGRAIGAVAGALAVALFAAGCTTSSASAPVGNVQLPAYEPGTPAVGGTEQVAASESVAAPEMTAMAEESAPAASASIIASNASTAENAGAQPGGTVYGAEIVADQQVVVAAQVNGQVIELAVDVGDKVSTGDLLVRQDSSVLEAQAAQAMAGLEAASSNLELLKDPAKEQDLAAARAAVSAASAGYQRATNGPTDEERRLALAQLKQAEAGVTVAQAAYNLVKGNPNVGMMPQSLQLQQATLAQEGAQAQYDKLMKGATNDQVAAAYAQLASARAQLQRLEDGARPAQVAAAEAQVSSAEYAYYLAQLQVSKASVKSPIDGVVSRVQTASGATAGPGTPLVTLLSENVRVTIPVEEARLSQLAVGQPAMVRVEAYPERVFPGTIAIIAPELDPTTRTVLVTVRPTDNDGLLAPGMSATVELQAK